MSVNDTRYEGQEEYTWQPYRIKPTPVWAMRMNRDFECKTLEKTLHGKAGDWLVRADDGWTHPVEDQVFRRFYVKREWRKVNESQSSQSRTEKDEQASRTISESRPAKAGHSASAV